MLQPVRFLHPEAFYLLLLILPLWLASRRHQFHLNRIRQRLNLGKGKPAHRRDGVRAVLATILTATVTVVLVTVLARPQIQTSQVSEVVRQLDVVFVLDTSPSMQSQDILPSRLDRARYFIKDVVTRQSTIQRVGLVTFSSSSLILSYLTSDVENVLFYLDYLISEPLGSLGTDLSAALQSGLKVIESSTEHDPEVLRNNRKAIVLISDGEDHGEDLPKALEQTTLKGIRVYTVGIGSAAGGFVPLGVKDGKMQYLEDSHGLRIVSRLNEETLRRIAQETGGRYYRSFEGSEIGPALQEILAREHEVVGYRKQSDWMDLYRPLISGAAVLLLAAVVVGKG